jgi:hypothetical protein
MGTKIDRNHYTMGTLGESETGRMGSASTDSRSATVAVLLLENIHLP